MTGTSLVKTIIAQITGERREESDNGSHDLFHTVIMIEDSPDTAVIGT